MVFVCNCGTITIYHIFAPDLFLSFYVHICKQQIHASPLQFPPVKVGWSYCFTPLKNEVVPKEKVWLSGKSETVTLINLRVVDGRDAFMIMIIMIIIIIIIILLLLLLLLLLSFYQSKKHEEAI